VLRRRTKKVIQYVSSLNGVVVAPAALNRLSPQHIRMSFFPHCYQVARSPFHSGLSRNSLLHRVNGNLQVFTALGSVRTATKRAGGTVHNHGGSPGKRLGVKKFSGPLDN
jgi:hypothetical protein